ncbi:MAG: endolytic transglycosylase MltG [Pseudomonadota bacterium]
MQPNAGHGDLRTSQRGGAVKSIILFLLFLGVVAGIALGAGGYFAYKEATRPGPLAEDAVVMLETGTTVSGIADILGEAGVIRHTALFEAAVRARKAGGALKAGEYRIPAGASVMEVIDLLVEGKSILHYFTAPEGRTTAQILRLLEEDAVLTGDITLAPNEGELLPETYALTRGESRDDIIRRMIKAQDETIDALWDGRALELPISTPEEAIILASIVERETGLAAERPRIAAVFINRLKKGMRLESDPTIIYGLTKGEPLGRGLRVSELRKETPYNTYVIRGLPPTPIANPGKDAIAAVLNPAETDEIFFVADGTGGHVFASTLREHNQNVAQWRRIERERQQ